MEPFPGKYVKVSKCSIITIGKHIEFGELLIILQLSAWSLWSKLLYAQFWMATDEFSAAMCKYNTQVEASIKAKGQLYCYLSVAWLLSEVLGLPIWKLFYRLVYATLLVGVILVANRSVQQSSTKGRGGWCLVGVNIIIAPPTAYIYSTNLNFFAGIKLKINPHSFINWIPTKA